MLEQIENQSFSELKANREANLKIIAEAQREELNARYLQARTDAKLANQRMGEQAKMLAELEGQIAGLHEAIKSQSKHHDELFAAKDKAAIEMQATYDAALAQLKKQHAEQLAAEQECTRKLAAVNEQQATRIAELEGIVAKHEAAKRAFLES